MLTEHLGPHFSPFSVPHRTDAHMEAHPESEALVLYLTFLPASEADCLGVRCVPGSWYVSTLIACMPGTQEFAAYYNYEWEPDIKCRRVLRGVCNSRGTSAGS